MPSSLPSNPTYRVRSGKDLYGDDLTLPQLEKWYREESEAFFSQNESSATFDPWYAYMRYVNCLYAFSFIKDILPQYPHFLSLGPGDGTELMILLPIFPAPRSML